MKKIIVLFAACLVLTVGFVSCNDQKLPDESTEVNSTEVITTDTEAPTTEVEITEIETEVPTTEEVTETQAVTDTQTATVTTEAVTTEVATTEEVTTEPVTTEAVTTAPTPPPSGGGGFVPPPSGGGGVVIPPVPTNPCANGHDEESHEAKAPTCTEVGWDAYVTCKRTTCTYTTKVEKEALGHDKENHEAKAPTCTEVGWDAYESCKREGCDYTTKVEKPVKHSFVIDDKKATCSLCENVCAHKFDEGTTKCKHCEIDKAIVDACEHNFANATCTVAKKCSLCGIEEGEALGHSVTVEKEAAVPATCTEDGKTALMGCERCDYTEGGEVVTKLGHDEESHEAKAPTCTEGGYDAYVTCKRCDYTTKVDKEALGHSFKDATCDAPKTCSVCEATEGEALGHTTLVEKKSAVAATCTKDGKTVLMGCERCNYTEGGEDIPATGHTFVDGVCACGALEKPSEGLSFLSNGDGTCIVGIGTCTDTKLMIPSESPAGDLVVGIGGGAFFECGNITSVIIPSTVTSIGQDAFAYCSNLEYIDIPTSVTTIGKDAFYDCTKLVKTENGVSYVDRWVVACDPSLEYVTLREDTEGIARNVFNIKSKVKSINIPENILNLDDYTFTSCHSLKTVTFAEGSKLERIGDLAFSSCVALTSIEIPASVTYIGNSALSSGSALTSVTFEEGSKLTRIHTNAFSGCFGLSSIDIPESVTSIGRNAFYGTKLITTDGGVSYVDNWVIECDGDKTKVKIKDGSVGIADEAFYSHQIITSINIPASVKHMGNAAFKYCKALTNVTFAEGSQLTSISNDAFSGCEKLVGIEIPASVVSIGDSAFYSINYTYCDELTSVTFAEGSQLKYIGAGAFAHCQKLTSIELPAGVISIGSGAFADCIALTSIDIPSSVSSIDEGAFSGCASLKSIKIPSEVTSIREGTFTGCSALKSIEIPEKVTSIGERAFAGCIALTSIDIPSSVSNIGNYAFSGCDTLAKITFGKDSKLQGIGNYAFSGCIALTSIEIPASVVSIGDYAFSDQTSLYCKALTTVTFGNNSQLKYIGKYAFYECQALESMELPASLVSIGEKAFYDCYNLATFYYGATEKLWNNVTKGKDWDYYAGYFTDNFEYSISFKNLCASGHDEVSYEAKAATCTEVGWDAYVTCKNCDYTTYSEKPATGHVKDENGVCGVCGSAGWTAPEDIPIIYSNNLSDKGAPSIDGEIKADEYGEPIVITNSYFTMAGPYPENGYHIDSTRLDQPASEKFEYYFSHDDDYIYIAFKDYGGVWENGSRTAQFLDNLGAVTDGYKNFASRSNYYISLGFMLDNVTSYFTLGCSSRGFDESRVHVNGKATPYIDVGDLVEELYMKKHLASDGTVFAKTDINGTLIPGVKANANQYEGQFIAECEIKLSKELILEMLNEHFDTDFTELGNACWINITNRSYVAKANAVIQEDSYSEPVTAYNKYFCNDIRGNKADYADYGVSEGDNLELIGSILVFDEEGAAITMSESVKGQTVNGINYVSNGNNTCYVKGITDKNRAVVTLQSALSSGDTVTAIFKKAFYGCEALTAIEIPASVEAIGYSAFANCYNLKTIYYTGTEEQWNAIKKAEGWDKNAGQNTDGGKYEVVFAALCEGGHDIETQTAKAPTCTEIGWDTYAVCKKCDYSTYKEKAASGHIKNANGVCVICTKKPFDAPEDIPVIYANDLTEKYSPVIDGVIGEGEYGEPVVITNNYFTMAGPYPENGYHIDDTRLNQPASEKFEYYFSYDDEYIYIAFKDYGGVWENGSATSQFLDNLAEVTDGYKNFTARSNYYINLGFMLDDVTSSILLGCSSRGFDESRVYDMGTGSSYIPTANIVEELYMRKYLVSDGTVFAKCNANGSLISGVKGNANQYNGQFVAECEIKISKARIIEILNLWNSADFDKLGNACWINVTNRAYVAKGNAVGEDDSYAEPVTAYNKYFCNDIRGKKSDYVDYGILEGDKNQLIGSLIVFDEKDAEIVMAN